MQKKTLVISFIISLLFTIGGCEKKVPKNNSNKSYNRKKTATLLEKGIKEYQQGNFNTATTHLNESIKYAIDFKDKPAELKAYNNLGNIQADKGNNIEALSFYQKALDIAEEINDAKYIAHINKNIGALYSSWKRFEESLSYYYMAEKAAINCMDSILYADCNNNIGTVLEQQKKYDKAITRYHVALEVYQKYNLTEGISMIYNNLAIIHKLKNDYLQAISYNKKSLEFSKKIGDKWAQAATLNNIGNLYGEIGDYEQAKSNCNQSLNLANKINAPEIVYNVYESLADAASKAKDFESALNYQKLFNQAKDDFNNIETNRHFSELTVKYETEKKEKENTLLKLENQKTTYEAKQANKQIKFILIITITLFISIVIIFRFYQRNQNNKRIIEQQNLANRIAFETEQTERARIARDLHDSVGQKLSVIKMQLSIKQIDDNTPSNILDEAIQEVRMISHNLLPPNLENGLIKAIENMCDEFNYNSFKPKMGISIQKNDSHIQLSQLTISTLYRIIQEFVNNTVKYADSENIHISMDTKNNNLHLTLSDDGKGFDFEKELTNSGIGLKNILERIKQLNGSVEINTVIGTTFKIKIPL